jgi:hypothetical protein
LKQLLLARREGQNQKPYGMNLLCCNSATSEAPPGRFGDNLVVTIFSACGHPQAGDGFTSQLHTLKLDLENMTLDSVAVTDFPHDVNMPMFQASVGQGSAVYSVAGSRGIVSFKSRGGGLLTPFDTNGFPTMMLREAAAVKGEPQPEGKENTGKPQDGAGACHISLDRTGRWLFVANYSGGNVAVLPVLGVDGRLGKPEEYATAPGKHEGESASSDWGSGYEARQEQAHPHGIFADPGNKFVHVADLGADSHGR